MVNLEEPRCGCTGEEKRSTRRGVLALAAGLMTLLTSPRLFAKKIAVKLKSLPALSRVGGYMIVKLRGKSVLLVRDAPTSVRGFTAHCSHQSHLLSYDPKKAQILCQNHGSRFDLRTGRPVNGPATKPLSRVYPTRLDMPKQRVLIDLD